MLVEELNNNKLWEYGPMNDYCKIQTRDRKETQ